MLGRPFFVFEQHADLSAEGGEVGLEDAPRLGAIVRDMPNPKPADVGSYLAARPAEVRAALVKVRAAMRRALPDSVEAIKYGMPSFRARRASARVGR